MTPETTRNRSSTPDLALQHDAPTHTSLLASRRTRATRLATDEGTTVMGVRSSHGPGRRLGHSVLALLGAVLVFFAVSGAPAWAGPRSTGRTTGSSDVAPALRALTSDAEPQLVDALLPNDFARVMGYRPVVVLDGGRDVLERRSGSCSSPFGATRYDFAAACRQHDLGYDLLRYADRIGHPLGGWARAAVDGAFLRHLHGRCSSAGCDAAADVYAGAVAVNSVRQLYRVPAIETSTSWSLAAVAGAVVLAVAWWRRLRRVAAQAVVRAASAVRDRVDAPVVAGCIGLGLSLVPTILPRPLLVQALVSAVVVLQLAAAAGIGRRLLRRPLHVVARRLPRPDWATAGRLRTALAGGCLAAVAAGVAAGQLRSTALLTAMGEPAPPPLATASAAGLAVAVLAALVIGYRAARRLVVSLRRSRRLRTALVAPAFAVAASLAGAGTASAAPAQTLTPNLGVKGLQFVRHALTASEIGVVTGRPALQPIRRYVGLSGAGPQRQAALAVHALEVAGGFDRAAVLLVVPTGSGWVDPAAVGSAEYLYGGDIATVAVQYDDVPSWVAYLRGTGNGQRSASALVEAVRAQIDARPAGHRPQLLVFGESLGALAGLHAPVQQTDGGLWVGVPGPARARAQRVAAGSATQQVLLHRDDPVAAWSPGLAVHDTAAWHRPWVPGVSVWQGVADLVSAYWTPDGYGHRYSREMVDGWQAAAHPAAPGSPPTDRLDEVRDAVGAVATVG
ncbi:alpha/beta-hydrolase family protein [Angustibacter sp. McL0619]|uniref:alpha/beta-hydrolase family protein n=1 Tax=Angustibacter sp. McL0619 TaxID=3415676 RepID=UPI003CE7D28D